MEELIFFAVIIFFSIIESIARKRKQRSGGPVQLPTDWEPEESERAWERETRYETSTATYETSTATYDTDRSYDEIEIEEQSSEPARRASSESMIPAEIWEEIAGLTRERARQLETRPEPPPPPPVPKAPVPAARDSWGKRTPKVGQQHRVHLAHAEYGTDPSERAPSAHDGLDPLARRLSADVRAVRGQLRDGRHALRQAVILQEVLGPPASMRPDMLASD